MSLTILEVTRRFPEVMLIEDREIRDETIKAIQQFPDYFWHVPASSSKKYHNPWCRNEHGLWMHVKMAFSALNRFIDSYVQQRLIDEYHADCARSAMLLHDMFKQDMPDVRLMKRSDDRHTVTDHDIIAYEWLRDNTELPDAVLCAVHAHNGPWYDGIKPADYDARSRLFHTCQLVHTADMAASSPDGTWGLYEPARELTDKYPGVPRANLK